MIDCDIEFNNFFEMLPEIIGTGPASSMTKTFRVKYYPQSSSPSS